MPHIIRKTLLLLSLIGALALVGFAMPVWAEEGGLDIAFSVAPAELVGPGDATMTFVITNNSGADVKNIYLTSADGLLSEPVGQVAAGESQTLVRPHAVTQEELDDGFVRYVLSHDAPGGEKVTHSLSAPVVKSDARPDIDFTRQLSSRYVTPDSQLTITYRVTNNGNVPVSAIYVRDALGDFTGRLEQLAVGATRTFISRVAIHEETQSEASLEYVTPSGDTITRKLEPITIHISQSALDASFSVGRSAFDPDRADAVLVLTNAGNDDYSGIAVLDDVYGGVIADGISLPRQGNPVEVGFTYPVRGDGAYRWRVTGTSQAGEALNFLTDTLALPTADTPRSVALRLFIVPRTPKISRPGNVTFDVSLSNEGTVTAKSLLLYEAERGPARRLAVLPTGDPSRFSVTYEVRQNTQFVFCLNYEDEDGRPRTISTEPIDIEIAASGVPPEPLDSERVVSGVSMKLSTGPTFTILLIVTSAALVSMFTILLITSLRARQERRRRVAEQKRRVREELGKTAKFTPVKGKEGKKPAKRGRRAGRP